jgi:hypothetical protein
VADFKLDDGEQILESCRVTTRERTGSRPARLVLTSERVVLCSGPEMRTPGVFAMFGLLGGVLGGLLGSVVDSNGERVEQQIAREDFAEVEVDGKWLTVRSVGEGYGRTTIIVQTKHAEDWQQHLHRWVAGSSPGTPLPKARVVRDD